MRCVLGDVGAVKLLGVSVRVIHVGAGAHGDEHMLAILSEDDVAGPVAAAGELGVAGDVGNDGLRCAGGVQVTGMVRDSLFMARGAPLAMILPGLSPG